MTRPAVDPSDRAARRVAPIAVVVASAGWIGSSPVLLVVGPSLVIGAAATHRRRRRRADAHRVDLAVIEFVDRIGQGMRGGGSLAGSVLDALDTMPDSPLRQRTEPTRRALQAGETLRVSLSRAERGDQPSLELVVTALTVLLVMGGPAASALDRLSDTLRLAVGARDEARAQAGQASASAALLAALPVAFGAVVALAEPAAADFYARSWLGAACVGVAAALAASGWWWMEWVIDP